MSAHNTRKPAHMEMIGGKSKRQRMWEAIRARRSGFSLIDIAAVADLEIDAVEAYVTALKRGQWLVQINDANGVGEPKRYELARDNGIEAPRVNQQGKLITMGLAQEQMWRTMRLIGEFDCHQLSAQASTPQVFVSIVAARDYISNLAHAGYVRRVSGGRGGVLTRWIFDSSRYSGPRPPMVQRTKSIYDPNIGKIVWQQEVNDDDL